MDIQSELDDLHGQLFELYQGHSTDILLIKRLWLRIDKLESIEGGVALGAAE